LLPHLLSTNIPAVAFLLALSAALPVIVSFTASSQTVPSGNLITLNCSVAGATTDIEVDDGNGSFIPTNSSCGGGISMSPTRTTLFKLVAGNNTGSDGEVWAYQRVFVGTQNLAASVTNCSGATQNSTSCVITIAVEGTFSNPYTDMVCDISFRAPSNSQIGRTSYWDPLSAVWKISLRPTESGAYSWFGYCGANPSGGSSNYTSVSGSFTSTASTAGGFLGLYGGIAPHRLKTEGDGKPFYPIGIQQGFGYSAITGSTFFVPMTQGETVAISDPGRFREMQSALPAPISTLPLTGRPAPTSFAATVNPHREYLQANIATARGSAILTTTSS
jgi:hypothetical protein